MVEGPTTRISDETGAGAATEAAGATTDATATHTVALATARKAFAVEIGAAVTSLVPEQPRLAAFFDALAEGVPVTVATKLAGHVPATVAAVAPQTADVARVFAAAAPNVTAEAGALPGDARAARMAELSAASKHATSQPYSPVR